MDAAGGFYGFVVGEGEDQLVGEVMVGRSHAAGPTPTNLPQKSGSAISN